MRKILIVDNNDSFVYNLVEMLRLLGAPHDLTIHDKIDFSVLNDYSHILLSPGAGIPSNYPNMMRILSVCSASHSILGVCLGHQAIASHFGAGLTQLKRPLHGHTSKLVYIDQSDALLNGITENTRIGRYHSWIVSPENLPPDIIVSARDEERNIMAIRHNRLPLYGVQFHPESIITQSGITILANWIKI